MAETAAEKKKREAKEAAAAKAKAEKEQAEKRQTEDKDKPVAKKSTTGPSISTKHDQVIQEKLAHGSTDEAKKAEAENYKKQQEAQAELERKTQHGLGFTGVREDAEK